MSGITWTVFNAGLFLLVGLQMFYLAARYKTCFSRTKLPRTWLWVFGSGCLLLGAGWLFQLFGYGAMENVFKVVGGLLFVANVPVIYFMRKAVQPTPPAR